MQADYAEYARTHGVLPMPDGYDPVQQVLINSLLNVYVPRFGPAALALLGAGADAAPALGAAFPARPVHTTLGWDDLVLHPGTAAQLDEIQSWLRHGQTLLHDWGMADRLRPGHRALFHGPPGTGKTMTATLLGQATGEGTIMAPSGSSSASTRVAPTAAPSPIPVSGAYFPPAIGAPVPPSPAVPAVGAPR